MLIEDAIFESSFFYAGFLVCTSLGGRLVPRDVKNDDRDPAAPYQSMKIKPISSVRVKILLYSPGFQL